MTREHTKSDRVDEVISARPAESAEVLAEREACARIAEQMYAPRTQAGVTMMNVAAETIAAAIRARGARPLTKAGPR